MFTGPTVSISSQYHQSADNKLKKKNRVHFKGGLNDVSWPAGNY